VPLRLLVALAFIVTQADAVAAQAPHSLHQLPAVDDTLLTRPIELQTGIGHAHDPAVSASAEAPRFFDQGLAYLHHFEWIEAARSFNRALQLDADFALAWSGLSRAHEQLGQRAQAERDLDRALALLARASAHDRRHVELRRLQMAATRTPRPETALASYRRALDDAIVALPSDVELLLERGIAESPDAADRGQGSVASSIGFYNRVLAIDRDNFAAHHYLTHAFENAGRIAEALDHGAVYARSAPAVPHALHMYGHDLRRVGRVAAAIAQFEAANRLATARFTREGLRPETDWHYEHNLDLLGTSYQHVGQIARAETALRSAFWLPTANLVQAVNKRQWLLFLRARGRFDEALQDAGALLDYPYPVAQAIGHIERGYALLAKKQYADAASAANAGLAAMKRASAAAGLAALPFEGLQGEFFLRTGQAARGREMLDAMLRKARAAQGPDEWAQTLFTLEAVAAAARDAGDWEYAGQVAQQMLAHDPAYAGSHYASALVAERQNQRATAAREFEMAAKYWAQADPHLPELAESRAKARSLTPAAPR
jgi:tetratricopeptide (TPR) repeat protein